VLTPLSDGNSGKKGVLSLPEEAQGKLCSGLCSRF
jgi:hypothetical protein